jgi:hypothetical protein
MMKKLVVLLVFLAMTSFVSAGPVWYTPVTEVQPSQTIVISLVDSGQVVGLDMEATVDLLAGGASAGGAASAPLTLNAGFTGFSDVGQVVNAGGILTQYAFGATPVGTPIPTVTGTLYSFLYHVPDLPPSTLITIASYTDGDMWDVSKVTYVDASFTNDFGPLVLHVTTPEPITLTLLGLGSLLMLRRKK